MTTLHIQFHFQTCRRRLWGCHVTISFDCAVNNFAPADESFLGAAKTMWRR